MAFLCACAGPGLGCWAWPIGLLVGLSLVAIATWAHLTFWRRRLSVPADYDLVVRIATSDGSAFELRRLQGMIATDATPVLMVHGIAVNHRNLDAKSPWSFARCVAAAGRDVWLLTLRSGRNDLSRQEKKGATFTAMAKCDLPEAVAEVLRRTGQTQLDYCGFSMGGILLYAALGRYLPVAQVRRVVIFGSPARIVAPWPLPRFLGRVPPISVPLQLLAGIYAPWCEALPLFISPLVFAAANTQPGRMRENLVDGVANIPGPLLWELMRWSQAGGTIEIDGQPILPALSAVTTPVLFVVGAADRLGPLSAMQGAIDAWGRDTKAAKSVFILGKKHGRGADYGHMDLVLGRQAPEEVYPTVLHFLLHGQEVA